MRRSVVLSEFVCTEQRLGENTVFWVRLHTQNCAAGAIDGETRGDSVSGAIVHPGLAEGDKMTFWAHKPAEDEESAFRERLRAQKVAKSARGENMAFWVRLHTQNWAGGVVDGATRGDGILGAIVHPRLAEGDELMLWVQDPTEDKEFTF